MLKSTERSSRSSSANTHMNDKKYRLYCLTNYYLSSLQKGLQTAHVVSELSLTRKKVYTDWAEQDRTIIILNGGNCANLTEFSTWLADNVSKWPWAAFHEDEDSLNDAITAVGIILPASVYTGIAGANSTDYTLFTKLQQLALAI